MAKKTGQLNVRIDPSLLPALEEIESRFRIGQSELVRGLVEAAVEFYKTNNYFAFPVRIFPEPEFANAVAKSLLNTQETASEHAELIAREKARESGARVNAVAPKPTAKIAKESGEAARAEATGVKVG